MEGRTTETVQNLERFGRELDWNLLRTFMVIVEEGGITAAARRLHLTQPAVSLALKRLEARLGRRLIERGRGTFRVTGAGQSIYAEVQEIFGTISRFGVLVREIPEDVSGHVRLIMTSRIQSPHLDGVLRDFHRAYPLATLSIDIMPSADIQAQVAQKLATVGVCLLREPVPGLRQQVLIPQTYRLYCGPEHPLFGRGDLTLADLRREALVSFTSDQIDGALAPLALFRAQAGFAGRVVGASANLDEVRRMILCGLGVGPLPDHVAADDVAAGRLWTLPPAEGIAQVPVYLIWNPDSRLNRAEAALIGMLVNEAAGSGPRQRTGRTA